MASAYPIQFGQYEGIYEVPDVARYIYAAEYEKYRSAERDIRPGVRATYRVTSRHLIRWIRKGLALESLSAVPGRDLMITFEDVVSMRVIAALRSHAVSFPMIYKVEDWLRQETKHPRPFAVEALWTLPNQRSGPDVLVDLRQRLVAASRAGQAAFEFFRDYIQPVHGLTFAAKHLSGTAVAVTWEPREYVLLDPEVQFGAPCIKGTRVPTKTIWGM